MITYVVPLRCESCHSGTHAELVAYLGGLAALRPEHVTVMVADGSTADVFARHRGVLGAVARHIGLDTDVARFANGKVAGVTTGIRAASTEIVILADDDVRYTGTALQAVVRALDEADLVVPQNVFPRERQPWHVRWDGARSLLNRAIGSDPPGTLAIRRSAFLRAGGYDGAVLFENLELIRTIEASGGRVAVRRDLAVLRLPPTTRWFIGQRIRQAYDEFARPARLVTSLAIAPAVVAATRRVRWAPGAVAVATIAVAEFGRGRDGGRAMFPASTSLFAPLWLTERAVCSWLAVGFRVFRGGIPYRGLVLSRAATSKRELERRYREQPTLHAIHRTAASSANARSGTAGRSLGVS